MGDNQPGTEVLKAAQCMDLLDIAETTIGEDPNGSKSLHGGRHHLASVTGVQPIGADILHDHNRWLGGIRE